MQQLTLRYYSKTDPGEIWFTFLNQFQRIINQFPKNHGKWRVTSNPGASETVIVYDASNLVWHVLNQTDAGEEFALEIRQEPSSLIIDLATDRMLREYRAEPTTLRQNVPTAHLHQPDGHTIDLQPYNKMYFSHLELVHLIGGPYKEHESGDDTIAVCRLTPESVPLHPRTTNLLRNIGFNQHISGTVLIATSDMMPHQSRPTKHWTCGLYLQNGQSYARLIKRTGKRWTAIGLTSQPHEYPEMTLHETQDSDWTIIQDHQLITCLADDHPNTFSHV